MTATTIDQDEINQFNAQAGSWWDESGPFKPLHELNPHRLQFIRDEILGHFDIEPSSDHKPFKNLTIADIGCGGGLIAEPLSRLGGTVTGVDAGSENIKAAKAHADQSGLDITYLNTTSEDLAAKGMQFDVVTALEIVEHVADVPLFLKSCCDLVKPGGMIIMSTLNRTVKSYALGILAAEYILKWVPKGTHQWQKFVEPADLVMGLEKHGVATSKIKGLSFNPLKRTWSIGDDLDVNYMLNASKKS